MQGTEHDFHNFSSSSSHRLPTVSGIEAIRNAVQGSKPIPTGLASVDNILGTWSKGTLSQPGLARGHVTEVFGPSGVGKTTVALQVAVNALSDEAAKVVWIDTSSLLDLQRFLQLVQGSTLAAKSDDKLSSDGSPQEMENLPSKRFCYMQEFNLTKLLALFKHPVASFAPSGTTLVVLDDISNLIFSALPRSSKPLPGPEASSSANTIRSKHAAKQAMSRRIRIISGLGQALHAFAAARNVAILVTSKVTISLRTGQKAILRPALTSPQWDSCLHSRIALYRDFWPTYDSLGDDQDLGRHVPSRSDRLSLRYAQITRLAGKDVSTQEIGFIIEQEGLREIIHAGTTAQTRVVHAVPQPLNDLYEIFEERDTDLEIDDATTQKAPDSIQLIDEPPLLAQNSNVPSKRKAIEISDSDEDEATMGLRDNELSSPGAYPDQLPMLQAEDAMSFTGQIPAFQTANKLRMHESDTNRVSTSQKSHLQILDDDDDDDDEMLIDKIEGRQQIPLFSQVAAEMSDPLTPSDDGHPSP